MYCTTKNPTVRQSRRDLGFLAGVARSIIARVAVVVGGVGAAGYAIDDKIRGWEESTYRPIIAQFDKFKEVTRPTKDYFINLKEEFDSKFNAASLQFNNIEKTNPSEHQSKSNDDEG